MNYKSRDANEGAMLAQMLENTPEWRDVVWGVYGGDEPTARAVELISGLKGTPAKRGKACLMEYIAIGWMGFVPDACRETFVMVPGNLAWLMWGWPNRFHARMQSVGSEIILLGPYEQNDPGTRGIDTPEDLALIPYDFDGYVWTNRIETIGPAIAALRPAAAE